MPGYDVQNSKFLRGTSIRTKFIIIISLLVSLLSLFIFIYFPYRLEQQAIESIASRAKGIASMAAESFSPVLLFNDKFEMENSLRNVRQNKDLVYLVVLTQNNAIFAQYNLKTAIKSGFNSFSARRPITTDHAMYRTACPIYHKNKQIGQLYLALSLEDLHIRVSHSRNNIAIVSLVIFILGVIVAFFISTAITGPLNKMIAIIGQISHGDLSQRIHYNSRDELGQLASSFNRMIQNLENSSFQLEQLNNNLEKEVVERTEKLQEEINKRWLAQQSKLKLEEELRQAQKMESIGTLAGGIAHDFNNILTAIMGYTELTLRLISSGSREYANLEKIFAASLRAKDLIQKILTFSRKAENKRAPIYLDEIVGEALKLMQSTLPSTIEIEINLPHMGNQVIANKSEIHQIVMNLCTNAAHAMRANGGILRVLLQEVFLEGESIIERGLTPGYYQHLSISDTGCGMHPAIMERIFEPYFTTKKEGDGTGMGLSVVHGIVKSYGGDITVSSIPEKGTTFNVFLPVAPPDAERDHLSTTEIVPRGDERIIVVDDEPAIVELEKEILESLGYTVTPCNSSQEALNIFAATPHKFDMLISDQTMPRLTGLQLVDKLRKIKPELPVLLCSGFSEVVNEDTYQSFGINAFLMKPIIKNEFARVVRKVLDEKK